jgi:hypothetical protein
MLLSPPFGPGAVNIRAPHLRRLAALILLFAAAAVSTQPVHVSDRDATDREATFATNDRFARVCSRES